MNIIEVINKVLETNVDAKTFKFKTRTRPRLNKKNRSTGEPTTFVLEVESEFKACLGVDYEKEVNEARQALGQTPDFESKKPAGKHYVQGTNWLMESDTTPGKFYVALSRFSDRTTKYYENGQEIGPERLAYIKENYMQKQKPALVEWKTYQIDNVISVEPV